MFRKIIHSPLRYIEENNTQSLRYILENYTQSLIYI